jgi:hypothetical protein
MPTKTILLVISACCTTADPLQRWPLNHRASIQATEAHPIISVAELGARPDNHTDNTLIFAEALRRIATVGGGTLLVPAGGVYLTLPLNLSTSGTRLRVERGATLKALCDTERWPLAGTPRSRSRSAQQTYAPFVGSFGTANIVLDGGGTIDGSEACLWCSHRSAADGGRRRGGLLQFDRVHTAELAHLHFINGPFGTLRLSVAPPRFRPDSPMPFLYPFFPTCSLSRGRAVLHAQGSTCVTGLFVSRIYLWHGSTLAHGSLLLLVSDAPDCPA